MSLRLFLFREETEEFQSCAFKEEDVTTKKIKGGRKKVTLLLEGFKILSSAV